MPNRTYEFVQLDVFTRAPLTGNPLAVFPDGHGLSDKEMQALAREMNLSETTFILPREPAIEAKLGKKVRIFTVAEELPFAGHPTLGTALYLQAANSGVDRVSLDLTVGKIPVQFSGDHENANRNRADGQLFGESDSQTLVALKYDSMRGASLLECTGARFFYFLCLERREGRLAVRARMFFYGGEDPATGSAAGCAASWLVKYGLAKSDEQVVIHQGAEAGRPSEIFIRAKCEDERVTDVRVGGYAVEILRGAVTL